MRSSAGEADRDAVVGQHEVGADQELVEVRWRDVARVDHAHAAAGWRRQQLTVIDGDDQYAPREIVELILTVGYYMMIARLLETTAVDLDPPAGTRVVDSIR